MVCIRAYPVDNKHTTGHFLETFYVCKGCGTVGTHLIDIFPIKPIVQ